MNKTAINWTDASWNPFSGCVPISDECARCYAETLAEQKRGTLAFPHGFGLTPRPHKLDEPRRVKEPSLIFTNSMSDPGLSDDELLAHDRPGGRFEGAIDRLAAVGWRDMDAARDAFFDAIEATPRHRYQVLTKRPEELLAWFRRRGRHVPAVAWIGVTIGAPKPRSLDRLDNLRRFRDLGARVLFVSAEPLLGDLPIRLDGIDWLITGGESGSHASDPDDRDRRFIARPATSDERRSGSGTWVPREDRAGWVRRLRDEAARAGTAHWFKQWGGPKPHSAGRLLDGRTWDEMPVHVPGAMPEGGVRRLPIAA